MHACVGKLNGIWCWQKDLLIFRENILWCMNGTVKEITVSSEGKNQDICIVYRLEENSRLVYKRGCGNGGEWGKRQKANVTKKKKKKNTGPDWPLDPPERKTRSWDL